MRALLPLTLALTVAGSALADDDKPGLLIMEFTADGVPGRAATSAEDLTAAAFAGTGAFAVISGADLQNLMQLESNKAAVGCEEESCLADIAGALGAEYVVTGRLTKLGELFVLKLALLEPAKARTAATETFEVKSLEDLAAELRSAGPRMTLVAFGKEVPPELMKGAPQAAGVSPEEQDKAVKAAVQAALEEQEAGPFTLTLIYGGLATALLAAGGVVVTSGMFVAAYVVNWMWAESPGAYKGVARTTGIALSFIGPLLFFAAIGGTIAFGTGLALE